MQREAWLFVRGEESIRIIRPQAGMTLLVSGPGSAGHSHHFDSEVSLEAFSRWYEQHLLSDGWTLQGAIDRRHADQEHPAGLERRRKKSDKTRDSTDK